MKNCLATSPKAAKHLFKSLNTSLTPYLRHMCQFALGIGVGLVSPELTFSILQVLYRTDKTSNLSRSPKLKVSKC